MADSTKNTLWSRLRGKTLAKVRSAHPVGLVEPHLGKVDANHLDLQVEEGSVVEVGVLSTSEPTTPMSSPKVKKAFSLKSFMSKKTAPDATDEEDSADLSQRRPIRLLIGYVPDVTERDAKFFVAGVAEKNVDSAYIGYMGLFKFGTGYAYEIQEGGHGRSYVEPIIQHYKKLPPNAYDKETAVFINTAQRVVQVERGGDGGLVCVQMPESFSVPETQWLQPGKKLKLLRDLNTGYMVASGAFLGIAFIVLIASYASRYQPYEQPPTPSQDHVSIASLPASHWLEVATPGEGQYVKTWKYSTKDKWQTEFGRVDAEGNIVAPPAPPSAIGPIAAGDGKPLSVPPPLPKVRTMRPKKGSQ